MSSICGYFPDQVIKIAVMHIYAFHRGKTMVLLFLYITFIWSPVNLNGKNEIMPFGGKYLQEMVKWSEG